MDPFGLVPMLTLLHIVLQVYPSAGLLTRPTLSVKPEYQEYYEGEKIRLICSAVRNLTVLQNSMVKGYRFFQEDGRQIHQTSPNAYRDGIMDFQTQMNNTGNYSCAYWLEEAGREVQSDQSHTTSIQVNAAPSAPSLNYRIFNHGKNVTLECSAPPEANKIGQFHFTGDKIAFSVKAKVNNTYTYNLTVEKDKCVGIIRCAYVQHLHGRNILSRSSNPVFIETLGVRWVRLLAVGGSFFTINGLIFLISYCISLRSRSPLQKTERTI
ncbi:immunoglobulin superfamily member 1-like [Vipera latastei]